MIYDACMAAKVLKTVQLKIGEHSLTFSPPETLDDLDIEAEQRSQLDTVLSVIRAYRIALAKLVGGRYQHLAPSLPEHLVDRCLIAVTCCPDGIIVRYDKRDIVEGQDPDQDVLVGTWSPSSVTEMVPLLSENSAYVVRDDEAPPKEAKGPTITLSMHGPGEERKEWVTIQSFFVGKIPAEVPYEPTGRPQKIIDTAGVLELGIGGEEIHNDPAMGPQRTRPFITRTPIKVKVNWKAFEVYSGYCEAQWTCNAVAAWAENDVLLTAARKNARDEQFTAVDPTFRARQHFAGLVEDFGRVLAAAITEEELQKFLAANPSFLEPAYVRVWPKLALGNCVTDFVFQRAIGDYLLVELEHPAKKLFTKAGVQAAALTQAIDQILDWRRYIEDNLPTVQRELGLTGITPNPKSMIVIGRSSDLDEGNRRKLATLAGGWPNLRIITYDDLRVETVQRLENIAGPLDTGVPGTDIYYPQSPTYILPGSVTPGKAPEG